MEKTKYYEPFPQEIFEEIKTKSIYLWQSKYSDEYGYVTEKVSRIQSINNIEDNGMFIIAMFDINNLHSLSLLLSEEAKREIYERLMSVDNSYHSIFI